MIFHSIFNKPVLIVGNGVRTSGAHEMMLEFVRKTNIPVLTTMNGVDLVQDDLHIGFIGTHGNRIANMVLDECDLAVAVGARLGIRQVGQHTERFVPKAMLVRADIDEYELSRNVKSDEKKYHTDARDFFRMLLDENVPDYSSWRKRVMDAKRILDEYDQSEGNLAVKKIASLLPPDPVVAVDVGQHQCWCAQSLHLRGNNGRILISGGYGTMGCGLPFAIGSCIVRNNAVTYCISGDGGLQMNIQEMETIQREALPIKIIVLNNKVLGKISETQHLKHNNRYANTTSASGYTVPDFEKIANAYGIRAATVGSYEELDNYAGWMTDDRSCLLNVMLSQDSVLVPKVEWETGRIVPQLENSLAEKVKQVLN